MHVSGSWSINQGLIKQQTWYSSASEMKQMLLWINKAVEGTQAARELSSAVKKDPHTRFPGTQTRVHRHTSSHKLPRDWIIRWHLLPTTT